MGHAGRWQGVLDCSRASENLEQVTERENRGQSKRDLKAMLKTGIHPEGNRHGTYQEGRMRLADA